MIIKIKIVHNDNDYLKRQYDSHTSYHTEDSGLDIFCPEDVSVPAGESTIVHLGIACEAYKNQEDKENGRNCGYYLYPRSSISRTPMRLANSVGIIDAGYRGELMATVDNINPKKNYDGTINEPFIIEKGKRLFQICAPDLLPFEHIELVDTLSSSSRGEGGFGSTGN